MSFEKPSRTARLKATKKKKAAAGRTVVDAKLEVRKRESNRCRFPMCGCLKLGINLEVSHDRHVGMGGGKPERSKTSGLMLLCAHRHQWGKVSIHKGTLKTVPLTDAGNDGPVRWLVDNRELPSNLQRMHVRWVEVAEESAGQKAIFLADHWQEGVLRYLATMEA